MARYQATVHLEGGQTEVFECTQFDVGLTDEGIVGSYDIKTADAEDITFIYLRPDKIVGIKLLILEEDES